MFSQSLMGSVWFLAVHQEGSADMYTRTIHDDTCYFDRVCVARPGRLMEISLQQHQVVPIDGSRLDGDSSLGGLDGHGDDDHS